jgi:hypothetical protein
MVTRYASRPLNVSIGGRRYRAKPGETVDADPRDVARLARFGVEERPDDEESDRPLEDRTVPELRHLADRLGVEIDSKARRAELLEALADHRQ